jgi:hypothetical protein
MIGQEKLMTKSKRSAYHSYLLRCWAESDETAELNVWRFSLEDPRTGQRRGFASLTELVIALQDELMETKQGVGSKVNERP